MKHGELGLEDYKKVRFDHLGYAGEEFVERVGELVPVGQLFLFPGHGIRSQTATLTKDGT